MSGLVINQLLPHPTPPTGNRKERSGLCFLAVKSPQFEFPCPVSMMQNSQGRSLEGLWALPKKPLISQIFWCFFLAVCKLSRKWSNYTSFHTPATFTGICFVSCAGQRILEWKSCAASPTTSTNHLFDFLYLLSLVTLLLDGVSTISPCQKRIAKYVICLFSPHTFTNALIEIFF